MNTYRQTAIWLGVLWIAATAATVMSQLVLDSIFATSDFLVTISAQSNQFVLAVLLELVDAFAVAGIAIVIFAVLRNYNERIAVGYVGFRVLEAGLAIAASISFFALLALSHSYSPNMSGALNFQSLGTVLVETHGWAYLTMLMTFSIGALPLYFLLYQTRLVPRWLSAFGFIGAAMSLAASLLQMFGVFLDGSTISNVLFFPIGIQEMVLALWLIVKGFNVSANEPASGKNLTTPRKGLAV